MVTGHLRSWLLVTQLLGFFPAPSRLPRHPTTSLPLTLRIGLGSSGGGRVRAEAAETRAVLQAEAGAVMVEMGGGVEGFPSQAGLVAFCREELVVKSLPAVGLIAIWT